MIEFPPPAPAARRRASRRSRRRTHIKMACGDQRPRSGNILDPALTASQPASVRAAAGYRFPMLWRVTFPRPEVNLGPFRSRGLAPWKRLRAGHEFAWRSGAARLHAAGAHYAGIAIDVPCSARRMPAPIPHRAMASRMESRSPLLSPWFHGIKPIATLIYLPPWLTASSTLPSGLPTARCSWCANRFGIAG